MRSLRNCARLLAAIASVAFFPSLGLANDPRPSSSGESADESLRFYGQLNRAFMYWDDGRKSSVYAVDNDTSSSRLGFIGKHRFSSELSGGYRVEVDSTLTLSSEVSSGDPYGDSEIIRLRHAYG